MIVWLRRALLVALAVLAAAYAHRPLLGVGFLGDDAATLVELDSTLREEGALAYWRVDALHGRPLAAWSLGLSKRWHSREGRYTPGDAGRLRLEGLALLVIAALGLRVAVRRGLSPWTGLEHGRSAGYTAAVLLMVHPLAIPAAAHLGDRGDMLGLAFGLWAIAVYLHARQERSRAGLAAPWALTLASAASSPLAYGLPVVLGVLELASADRHRQLGRRCRTAANTFVGFTLALLIERALRALVGGEASHVAHVDRSPLALLGVAAEKLGVFLLPVNTSGVGVFGYLLAVLAVLAALHPAFVAARAAPRLWGRILGAWAACIAALLALTWSVRSAPAELGDARTLLAGAALMAAGLGVASTALYGARRTLLPAIAIAVYAPLAAGSAATIQEAAQHVGALQSALLRAGEARGYEGAVVIVDPPRHVAGVAALLPQHEAALVAQPFLKGAARPFEVYGLPRAALRLWSLDAEAFDAVRRAGATLLVRDPAADTYSERPLSAPADTAALPLRFGPGDDLASAPPLDPWRTRSLTVVPAGEPTRAGGAPLLRYSPASAAGTEPTVTGGWLRTEDGWRAHFDLERDVEWLLAGTVRDLRLPGELAGPREALLGAELPGPGGLSPDTATRPRAIDDDWVFEVADAADPRALDASRWVLALWDPMARTYEEHPATPDGGRLRVVGVATVRSRAAARHVRWSLERRVEGVTVERATGWFERERRGR